jgi:short-subunit dehydrogenase
METTLSIQSIPHRRSRVMVTGATGGLGKAFAVECASRGWDLFLTDLHLEPLEQLKSGLERAYGISALTQACDLTDPAACAQLFVRFHQEGLRFWGLINVAGTDFEGPFFEQSPQQIRTIVRLNVEGTLEMTRALLEFRDPLQTFRIINVASLAAFYPMPVKATYAASKRFLLDFSLALREEVREIGATVTALCPAGLPTTPEVIRAIDAQGWAGQATTQNIGSVANETLNAALRGKAVVIPGWTNRVIQFLSSLLPEAWVIALIARRWNKAQGIRTVLKAVEAGD